ncbi:MAG: helix-turn-helix transcriptional regulator [Planctomycetes bacterium]|nr:helix-turn-helix transcriptional regulator [Planctomycetota bacterium]
MARKKVRRRILRKATAAERKRHQKIREQIEREKPELIERGRRLKAEQVRLRQVLEALRAARLEMGITLSELAERTGIAKSNLSRLENAEDANPTVRTLSRYAEALGKELVISIESR